VASRTFVHLATVGSAFHAQVLAARLRAAGIATELRGAIGGTYPVGGPVEVLVDDSDAPAARALLLADALEPLVPEADPEPGEAEGQSESLEGFASPSQPARVLWAVAAVTACLVLVAMSVLAAVAGVP
jgi:hypothetical protein